MTFEQFKTQILEATFEFTTSIHDITEVLELLKHIAIRNGTDVGPVRLLLADYLPDIKEKLAPISVEEAKNRFDKILDDYQPTGNKKTPCKPVSPDLITPAMVESEKQLNELKTAVAEKLAAQEKAEEKRDGNDALIVQGILALMEDKEIRWTGRFTKKDMERLEIPAKVRAVIGSYVKGPPIKFLKKSFVMLKRVGKRAVWEFEFSV